jgi:hypothetical protein
MLIGIIQVIQSLMNLWWKFLLSGKNPPHSSWLYTTIDCALFIFIGWHFQLYQLLTFELFFMFVALGLFSRKLKKLHYVFIGIFVTAVYLLNTINPVTTLELLAVFFFILAVYFWANNKRRLGWIFIIPGHLFLLYALVSKGAWIIVVAQLISLVLAIRGIKNSKPVSSSSEVQV